MTDTARDNLPPPGAPDIEIARAARMDPILPLAEEKLGLPPEALVPHGHYKAKLSHEYMAKLKDKRIPHDKGVATSVLISRADQEILARLPEAETTDWLLRRLADATALPAALDMGFPP